MALLDHRPAGRRLILLVLLPLTLLLLGSAWWVMRNTGNDSTGLPNGPVSYAQITAHPEARLYYPGSRVFSPFGGPERSYMTLDGREHDPAFAGAVLTSNATPARIYLWYQLWLLKHGWRSHADLGSTNWKSLEGYARGFHRVDGLSRSGGGGDGPPPAFRTDGVRDPLTILPAGQTVP